MTRTWSLAVAMAAATIIAVSGVGVTAQTVSNTKHDLSSGIVTDPDHNEVCVYCHTPHGSNTAIEAPLWNKPASGATYTTYDSTTIDGDVLAVGSVSIACLSCHDGTQAMDTVINAPGSGGHNPLGTSMAAGPTITNTVVNLTNDLRDDHPIGVQYGGYEPGGIGTGKIDPDFKGDGEGLQVAVINLKNRWWVDTEVAANGTREKTDMILYTRDNSGDQPFVECASCHDPHDDSNDTFLRISNESSDVCLACHVK